MPDTPVPWRALPLVLTAEEAAEILRVDIKTVYDAVTRRQLPATRVGRKGVIRIGRDALLSLLQGRVVPEGK